MVRVEFKQQQNLGDFDHSYYLGIFFENDKTGVGVVLRSSLTREQVSEALLDLAEKVLGE